MPPALILSQDQTLMFKVDDFQLPALAHLRACARRRTTARPPSVDCLNAKALMALAALFSLSSCPRLHPEPRDSRHPRADTRRVVSDSASPASALARLGQTRLRRDCVCLHALSSFQRTDRCRRRLSDGRSLSTVLQGNLLRLLPLLNPVKPFLVGPLRSARGRPNRWSFGEPYKLTKLGCPCQPLFFTASKTLG
jgi:hypothetical protein